MEVKRYKPLFDAFQSNLIHSKETIGVINRGIEEVEKLFLEDLSKRERDFGNLEYLARDLRDNLKFTVSLIDEVNIVDELITQINLLALNISIEANKESETTQLFGELAKDIREKSDKIQMVIERIYTKEVRNKSFSEHNRYIQNSVLPLINERVESMGGYLQDSEDLVKELKKSIDETHTLSDINSNNMEILTKFSNLLEDGCGDTVSLNQEDIEEMSEENSSPPQLNESDRVSKPHF
jgi:ribosomal protein L29